jgi:phage protein D/phage baseplate assembly protein gpV
MPIADLANRSAIEIDGIELAGSVESLVQEVIVDDHLLLPDTFEIHIFDPQRTAIGVSGVRIGSGVRISATALGNATPHLLISGEVTSIEAEYGQEGAQLVVRGYDHSHRLSRGRRTKTFNQVTYSDIAGQLADGVSLPRGTIDPSGAVVAHVSQANQSDWEFLRELAREIDFEVAVVDGRLDFRRPTPASDGPTDGDYSSSDPLQLVFGQDLLSFRPRVTSIGQVGQVEVRGWSVGDKQAIVGTAQAGTLAASLADDPASLAGLFGDTTFVSVAAGPADQSAADRLAGRFAEVIGSSFAEAVGVARGNPRLKAGSAISVSMVGDLFVGRYTLTHTRHRFDLVEGYRTQIVVSGRSERSLLGLTAGGSPDGGGAGGGPSGGGRSAMSGVAIALVDDVDDPSTWGRVRLRFPWLSDDYVSDWARVAMLGAGPDRGAAWLPEHGDEVLVAFEQGDMRRPVVLGGLWNGQDHPPTYAIDRGRQKVRSFVSRLGHRIAFHDADDESSIELSSADGSLTLVLDQTGGEIVIKAGGSSKVTISAGGDLSLAATGKLTLSGEQGAELKSSGTTVIKGSVVQVN